MIMVTMKKDDGTFDGGKGLNSGVHKLTYHKVKLRLLCTDRRRVPSAIMWCIPC